MATQSSISTERHVLADTTHKHLFGSFYGELLLEHLENDASGRHRKNTHSEPGYSLCKSGDTLGSVVYVPCEVTKQRMQVQGTMASRSSVVMKDNIAMKPGIQMYKGWLDAIRSVWRAEGAAGMFRGSIPRITWDIPASALTFMAVEFLRENVNEGLSNENTREVASMTVEKKGSPLQGAA